MVETELLDFSNTKQVIAELLLHSEVKPNFCVFIQRLRVHYAKINAQKLPWLAIIHQFELKCAELSVEFSHLLLDEKISNVSEEKGVRLLESFAKVLWNYKYSVKSPWTCSYLEASATVATVLSTKQISADYPCRRLEGMQLKEWVQRSDKERDRGWQVNDSPWGQRKLLLMELEFLTNFSKDGDTVLYVGAGPGDHIPFLAGQLFPKLKFILYDAVPFGFDPELHDLSNVTIVNDLFRESDAHWFAHEFNRDIQSTSETGGGLWQ